MTQAAKDLIDKMLITEQNERISAANALKHPWIVSQCLCTHGSTPDVLEEEPSLCPWV